MTAIMVEQSAPKRATLSPLTIVLHAWSLAPLILVHVGALAIFLTGSTWGDWLGLALIVYVRGLVSTIGYHRFFSHRCFKTSRVTQFILAVLCCTNLQQGPLWWAAYHRHHHRHSDAPSDVHSPHHGGFWWAYCGWLFIPLEPKWSDVRDLRRFPELVWLERFWQIPGLIGAALCWWLGGVSFLCVAFCFSAVLSFQMTFVVNTLGHLVGSRRYPTPDHSTNSFLLAALSLGDGWHNNHHHYPHAAQAGFRWFEIDGSFRVIRLLELTGIVWDVRRVPEHKLAVPGEAAAENEAVLAARTEEPVA